jgi:hypothetical protein
MRRVLEPQLSLQFESAAPTALSPKRRYTRKPKSHEMTDAERDARTGPEWIDAAKGYLDYRMGRRWRRLGRALQRYNSTRWYYLDGWRLVNELNWAAKPCACPYCLPQKKSVQSAAPKFREVAAV